MQAQAKPSTLAEWLTLLETRHTKSIDMGLERVGKVKELLDIRFDCPVITVAGTNGKGSTCAMLESILMRAGYRVGLYIKPHFLHFNERARVEGTPASASSPASTSTTPNIWAPRAKKSVSRKPAFTAPARPPSAAIRCRRNR